MIEREPDWRVLLIGGHSAAVVFPAAERLGLSFGVPWLQVDDLRRAFLRAQATLPEGTETCISSIRRHGFGSASRMRCFKP